MKRDGYVGNLDLWGKPRKETQEYIDFEIKIRKLAVELVEEAKKETESIAMKLNSIVSDSEKDSDSTPKRELTITIGHPDYIDFERDVPEEVLQNSGVPRGLYTETEDERQIRLEDEYYADPSNYDNRRRASVGARIGLAAREQLRNLSSARH